MLLLLHDLFLVVGEMIVMHHIILFPARSDDWRPIDCLMPPPAITEDVEFELELINPH